VAGLRVCWWFGVAEETRCGRIDRGRSEAVVVLLMVERRAPGETLYSVASLRSPIHALHTSNSPDAEPSSTALLDTPLNPRLSS
jgi:hypothetical protein